MRAAGLVLVAFAALAVAGAAHADHTMNGFVGPGFTIDLMGTSGVQPGVHDVVVSDVAMVHNYHLFGPNERGRDGTTSVTGTFVAGGYMYVCGVHADLNGSFTVGSPPPPPPPPPPSPPPPPPTKTFLLGSVGPGAKIALVSEAGKRVGTLAAGVYTVVVSDRTKADNFYLTGPSVNRKTGVGGKGTLRWKVRLKPGKYRYRSDAHASPSKTFRVRS